MKRGEREKGVLGHVHEDDHDVFVAAEITRNRLQVKIAESICAATIPHYFQDIEERTRWFTTYTLLPVPAK